MKPTESGPQIVASVEKVDIGTISALGTGEIVEVEVVVTRMDGTIDRYVVLTER